MDTASTEAVLRSVANLLETVVMPEQPVLEGELSLDGSRFEGLQQPVVPSAACHDLQMRVIGLHAGRRHEEARTSLTAFIVLCGSFRAEAKHSFGETERHSLGAETFSLTRERNGSHPAGAGRSVATEGWHSR